jgi:hypothetical protein
MESKITNVGFILLNKGSEEIFWASRESRAARAVCEVYALLTVIQSTASSIDCNYVRDEREKEREDVGEYQRK